MFLISQIMLYKKAVSLAILVLAKRVYETFETFKLHFSAIGLNQKIDEDIALLGETMFKLRVDEVSFLDRDLSILADKIRADRNIIHGISNNKNNYLLNSYIYISNLFNKFF